MFILANSLIALPLQAKEINLLKPAKVQDPSVSNNTERTKKNTINDTEKEISFIPIPEFLLTISSNSDSLSLNERLIVADRRNLSTEIAQPSSASSSSLIEKEKDDSVPLKLSVEENSSFQTNDFDLNTNKPETAFNQIPESITVKNFEIVGSSIFTEEELKKVTTPFTNRPLSFGELFQARSAITKLYTDRGYVNSGAYIPPQELEDGQVTIEVLEGELEEINITGTNRLDADYIRPRLLKAGKKPVNVDSLLEALQLLRLDPLIDNVSAELSAGIRPGKSHLDIQITEADPFTMFARLDNSRSPSVGTDRRSFGFIHSNLLGFGDRLEAGYTNTDGSYGFDFAYSLPMNASDGKLRFAFGVNSNDVIEEPFNPLDIESKSRYYELNFRQPLILKPGKELAFGIAFSRQESETSLLNIPFALSRGADEEGDTRISAIRFFQEWVNRDEKQVFAARSQFSVGLDLFEATINEDAPDSTFFAWQGQAQWVRRLDEDFLFVLRGDVQLSPSALVPLEQFRLGGIDNVRGYRQDLLLGDSGLFASAEVRIPIIRFNSIDGVIQLTPFFDIGTVWNSDEIEIDNETLSAIGLGLNFTAGDRFSARLDWGIPLVDLESDNNSLQENGIYFSINYNFF